MAQKPQYKNAVIVIDSERVKLPDRIEEWPSVSGHAEAVTVEF